MFQAIAFLLNVVVGFLTGLLLLRFFMQWTRTSFYNQLGSFAIAMTDWAVKPLRRVVPGLFGVDLASLVGAFFLQAAEIGLLLGLSGAVSLMAPEQMLLTTLLAALRGTLRAAIWLYIGALFLQAILSWVNPYSPLAAPLNGLTRPLLTPIQRILPPISGFDLSPMVAIVLLQLVLMFV